jgi:MoxR-like ATPase
MTTLTNIEQQILDTIKGEFPNQEVRTRDLRRIAGELGDFDPRTVYKFQDKMDKVHKGLYSFHALVTPIRSDVEVPQAADVPRATAAPIDEVFVPEKDATFVRWGHSKDIETIIKSGQFYPIWVYGLSGNGKTFMVEQVCAKLGRPMLRVQVSEDTDEDSLIGGYRLVNGNTVFEYGPVVRAMLAGAVLLIDEIDRPERPLMCLQGVLEGKPILIKKTGEVITPAPGFTVVATGNTQGRGSDDGKFISARILDEALLERFVLTLQQPYATATVEKKIVLKHMEKYGKVDEDFADKLVLWAEAIRKTYEDDGVEDIITTRRLGHICRTYAVFDSREKAIELCISRFDEESRAAFADLYAAIDPNARVTEDEVPAPTSPEEVPF